MMPLKQQPTQNDSPFGYMQDIQGNKGGDPGAEAMQGMMKNSGMAYNPMSERLPDEEMDNDQDDALSSMKKQYGG